MVLAPPMSAPAVLFSPAKVNLALKIVGRRADGYHLIESVMVAVTLYDELFVEIGIAGSGPGIHVETDRAEAPGGPENTVYRAIEGFFGATGLNAAIRVRIHKRIPAGSGLGGASSDAASILRYLNGQLTRLSWAELSAIANRVGADVAFFFSRGAARVSGVGDVVRPFQHRVPRWLVLASSLRPLATERVYREYAGSLTSEGPERKLLRSVGLAGTGLEIRNDLEDIAGNLESSIPRLLRDMLRLGALAAGMSGSGSAVFGIASSSAAARSLATRLGLEGYWARAVESVDTRCEDL